MSGRSEDRIWKTGSDVHVGARARGLVCGNQAEKAEKDHQYAGDRDGDRGDVRTLPRTRVVEKVRDADEKSQSHRQEREGESEDIDDERHVIVIIPIPDKSKRSESNDPGNQAAGSEGYTEEFPEETPGRSRFSHECLQFRYVV